MGQRMVRRPYWVLTHRHRLPARYIARAAVSKFLMRMPLCRLLTIHMDGYRLRFYPSSLSRYYWTYGRLLKGDERQAARAIFSGVVEVVALLRRLLRPGDVFVDVGANIGALTCQAAARVGPSGRVYAFEPHPRVCHFLRGNVRLNDFGNVAIHCSALGDADREVSILDGVSDEARYVSEGRLDDRRADGGQASRTRIRMRCLDAVDTGDGEIALLKIDVEGYEGLVLNGARATLARCQAVVFEASDAVLGKYGWTASMLIETLEGLGFVVLRPQIQTGSLRPIQTGYRPPGGDDYENLVAVKSIERFARLTGWHLEATPRDDGPVIGPR